jgi:hypothetical protein
MARRFNGIINVDTRDSVPDWAFYVQPVAPEGSPNVLYAFDGGTIKQAIVDVSGEQYVDLEKEALALMKRE